MPASKDEVEEVKEEGAAVHCGWGPKEILTENGKVRGIVLKKCVSVKDETGHFNPQFDENETMTVECEHVYLSIGQSILWGDILAGLKWNLEEETEQQQIRLLTRPQNRISLSVEMSIPDRVLQSMRSQREKKVQSPFTVLYMKTQA